MYMATYRTTLLGASPAHPFDVIPLPSVCADQAGMRASVVSHASKVIDVAGRRRMSLLPRVGTIASALENPTASFTSR